MKFNTYEFLCMFLPLVLLGFSILRPLGRRLAVAWLVMASLFFYAWWEPIYLLLLLGSMLGNFLLGLAAARVQPSRGRRAKLLLGIAVGGNLAALAWFKYAGFLAGTIGALGGPEFSLGNIILPLAISFFTFQQIAYQVDCYYRITSEHSFLDYCLFVSFFPQLVAGPIVHHGTILPQVTDRRLFRVSAEGLSVGMTFLVVGLAKKVLIADNLAPHASLVFHQAAEGQPVDPFSAWAGAVAFACQIYFDFSGYSDMAVGLGRMFGIRLPRNFNSPLRATSTIELWNRWHITLSNFLRDYLFFPLCGKRPKPWRRHMALMLTMTLGGLWHGAAWTFVIWGALHGLFLLINHSWRHFGGGKRLGIPPRVMALLGWALTFGGFSLSMVFFRAEDLDSAMLLLGSMVGLGEASERIFSGAGMRLLGLSLLLLLALPNINQWFAAYRPTSDQPLRATWLRWQPRWYWWLPTALLGLYTLTQLANISEFLYYNF